VNLFSNPEFLRYARTQLRPNKVLIAAITSAVISISIGFVLTHSERAIKVPVAQTGLELLFMVFYIQAFVLAVGGGIACLNSIYSEKDHNTFDYQRITRLSSLELTLGKLFGAPLLMYFICLCFVPLAFYAAVLARARVSLILAAYLVLIVSSLTFQALTLLLSLLTIKGSQVTGVIVCLVLFSFFSIDPHGTILNVSSLGPFESAVFATARSWLIPYATDKSLVDSFFGFRVHHFLVLVVVDLFFFFSLLLAVVRNIKRDPQRYEVYSPTQSILFSLILNFLLIGFFVDWTSIIDSQSFFLTMDFFLFALLGITLLHNRERARSLLMDSRKERLWIDALWPAPILFAGAFLVNVLIVAKLFHAFSPAPRVALPFALLRSLAFIFWVVCNFQFLQCMNLRRGKHPLLLGVLYLFVYYACITFVLSSMHCFEIPQKIPIGSLFVPSAIYLLDGPAWHFNPSVWIAGFVIQLVLIALFSYLQFRQLHSLKSQLQSP